MTEMVEPDRTIMIVSIIGLVVIWGSFFYHKYLQGGSDLPEELAGKEVGEGEDRGKDEEKVVAAETALSGEEREAKGTGTARRKGKKRRR